MEANSVLTINKVKIPVENVEMNQVELLFYPDNPRVFSQLHLTEDDSPSQETLEKKMCSLDHVKDLKMNIEANGGLVEPIYVRGHTVLEGNSRLAAYRLLAKKDKEKWAKIKCVKLPDDIQDELVFALLGSRHMVGQTPWSAFEKACYINRMLKKSRKHIEALANEMGLKVSEAQLSNKVYIAMVEAEDVRPNKWSYYYELYKSNPVVKADEENPHLNIIPAIIDKIKHDEIEEARDVRKIATIVKANNEEALDLLTEYLAGEKTLDDAVEQASEVNKEQCIKKGVAKFHKLLCDNFGELQTYTKTDADLNMRIKQIEDTLKSLIQIK